MFSLLFDGLTKKLALQQTTAKARAYRSVNQAGIANGVITKVQLNAETYDPGNNFDSNNNYRFTAPVAGYYLIIAHILWDNATVVANKRYHTNIYVNGAEISYLAFHSGLAAYLTTPGANIVYLAANDYVELFCFQLSGVTQTITGGPNYTYMVIHPLST